jgi:hypothetical protein
MSWLVIGVIVAVAILLSLVLAYLPMRILLTQMAKSVAAPIREFMQRQRERRAVARQTPDRRRLS